MALPSGYLELDYITTSGSQYINTGFTSNANMSAEFKFEQINSRRQSLIFGSAWDANAVLMHLNTTETATLYWGSTPVGGTIPLNSPVTVKLVKNKWTINNTDITTSGTPPNWGAILFGGIASHYTSQVRLYYLKLWNSGTLVRDMIPCIRISDWKIGMYDQVNNIMYINARSADNNFIAGPVKNITQSDLIYHNYINSAGSVLIDTGVCVNDIGKMFCKFRMNFYPQDSTLRALLGASNPSSSWQQLVVRTESNGLKLILGEAVYITISNPPIYTDYEFNIDRTDNTYIASINNSTATMTLTKDLALSNLFLFADNKITTYDQPGYCRIYNTKIYNRQKTLIRNLKPAEISSLGVPGFWDDVNNKFYVSGYTAPCSADDRPPKCHFGVLHYIRSNGASTNYVHLGRSPSAQKWKNTALTISMWAYVESWSSSFNPKIMSCTEGGGWGIVNKDQCLALEIYISGSYRYVKTRSITSMTTGWHHFCATYDGLALKMYYDGNLENTTSLFTSITGISYANVSLTVACESSTSIPASPYYNGVISNLRVITDTLTHAEVQQLYISGHDNNSIDNFNGKYFASTMFNFVPARRFSDSKNGFFDLAQGQFYPSNGSVNFDGAIIITGTAEHGTITPVGDITVGTNISVENYTQIGYASLGLYDENDEFITRDNPYTFTAVENKILNLKSIPAGSCTIL